MKDELLLSHLEQDDEIDLFKTFETLWAGKWIITAFAGIALAFGFLFNFYKEESLPPPHFAVLAPYTINLFSPFDNQICNRNSECINNRVAIKLKKLAQDSWSTSDQIKEDWKVAGINLKASNPECPLKILCLVLITRSPQDPEFYDEQLRQYNQILLMELRQQIEKEILAISELKKSFENNVVLSSRPYASNNLELHRYLSVIEDGQAVINFGEIDFIKVTPPHKQNIIIVLSFVLGGVLGSVIVLLRSMLSSRRDAVG